MLDGPWTGASFAPVTAIDIATIENAILAQLRANINTIEIAHYPDRPETWRLTHRVGAALVMYKGSLYGDLLDTDAVIQERNLEFEIALMMRDLGWSVGGEAAGPSPGAYAIIEQVRSILSGFVVPGCRKMRPVREKFVQRDKKGGVWTYALTFAMTTLAVEASAIPTFPLFIRGVALEEGGQTTITVGAASYPFDSTGKILLPHGNVFGLQMTAIGGGQLTEGTDFTVDRADGVIAAIAVGAISPNQTVQIAYAYAEEAVAMNGDTAPTN
jgi:Gp37 protein